MSERQLAEMRSALKSIIARTPCLVLHQGAPHRTTCVGVRDLALSGGGRFAASYRSEIIDRKHYCRDCEIRTRAQRALGRKDA